MSKFQYDFSDTRTIKVRSKEKVKDYKEPTKILYQDEHVCIRSSRRGLRLESSLLCLDITLKGTDAAKVRKKFTSDKAKYGSKEASILVFYEALHQIGTDSVTDLATLSIAMASYVSQASYKKSARDIRNHLKKLLDEEL